MTTHRREQTLTPQEARGADGNTKLTSATGLVLLVMLAVEGFTVLNVRGLITLHIFLGVMLVGPAALKIASTLYRFGRYYTGNSTYVAKGPPHIVLRVLGPFVTLTSVALLGTGLALIWQKPHHGGLLLTTHKASFIVWFAVMTIHVLGHVQQALAEAVSELHRSTPQRVARLGGLAAVLSAGVILAAALIGQASPWTSR